MSKLDHENMESDSEEFVTRMHSSFNTYIILFLEQAVHETLMREKRSTVCGVRPTAQTGIQ